MQVVFDTSAFLIAHADPDRLGEHRDLLERPSTVRLVPAVVPWEITIKYGLGKLDLPQPPAEWFPAMMRRGAMTDVAITAEHTLAIAALPSIHRDPFDRLVITVAAVLGAPVVTSDRVFSEYDIEVLGIG